MPIMGQRSDMVERKMSLGRGLNALIPETKKKEFVHINIEDISPNPYQPRKDFDPDELNHLADSIREKGVLQPIVVRRKGNNYELIVGERRWRASKSLGNKTIPAMIKDLTDEEALEVSIIENIQREDLDPIEKALAYKQLFDDFNLTQEELAQRLGQSRASVANTMRLLNLPDAIKDALSNGKLSMGHARTLLGLSEEMQMQIFKQVTTNGMSVRDIEEAVRREKTKAGTNRAGPAKRKRSPHIDLLEEELQALLGTKVRIRGIGRRGRIELHYFSLDDMDRLLEILKSTSLKTRQTHKQK